MGSPMAQHGKDPPQRTDTRDASLIRGSGRFPREEMATPSVFLLKNPMDRRGLGTTVHGIAKSWTQLSD